MWAGGPGQLVGIPSGDTGHLLQRDLTNGSPRSKPRSVHAAGIQAESSFQECVCTGAAVTFHWENKSRIKIFFFQCISSVRGFSWP